MISIDVDTRGVARLTLARPDKRNALNPAMIAGLAEAATRLRDDRSVRLVVLQAQGESFCGGGDLGWMRVQLDATREQRIAEAMTLARMLRALDTLPKPLIGRIHGDAYGGGVGLMAICDVCIVAASARFGLTETRLGLIPATIGPYVIARIGVGAARRFVLSGRRFDAATAQSIGLAAEIVPAAKLDTAIGREIDAFLAAAPGAVARAKAQIRALGPSIDDAAIADSVARLADVWEEAEAAEGVAAFFDRRPPRWGV